MNRFGMEPVCGPAMKKVLPGAYVSPEVKCMDIVLEKGFAQSGYSTEDVNESEWM
jgi:hypothetical protein